MKHLNLQMIIEKKIKYLIMLLILSIFLLIDIVNLLILVIYEH